jgi:hypothetical protein
MVILFYFDTTMYRVFIGIEIRLGHQLFHCINNRSCMFFLPAYYGTIRMDILHYHTSALVPTTHYPGYLASGLLKKYLSKRKVTDLKASLYPLIVLFFSGTIEHFFSSNYEYAKVESITYLRYDASTVYDLLNPSILLTAKNLC